jgi:TnpA family transposase
MCKTLGQIATQATDLRIEEHYTDTAGFTDHVFALCHLLGFRFAPRIRDLADKRLYVPGRERDHAALAPLIGGKLNLKTGPNTVGGNTSARRVHPARHGDRLAYHPQARQLSPPE